MSLPTLPALLLATPPPMANLTSATSPPYASSRAPTTRPSHSGCYAVICSNTTDDETAFLNALCRRIHRPQTQQLTPQRSIPILTGTQNGFPPLGFHIVNLDSNESYILTTTTSASSVRLCARNLVTTQYVSVSAPRGDLAGIYMLAGKVFLVCPAVACDGATIGYSALNLGLREVGSGEVLNRWNMRPVAWCVRVGNWVRGGCEVRVGVVEVMRLADVVETEGLESASESREMQEQIDHEELAMGLVEMTKELARRKKGRKEMLLSVWR